LLGEKSMIPAELAEKIRNHEMNGEAYNFVSNNWQKWLKQLLDEIDTDFAKELPKNFRLYCSCQSLRAFLEAPECLNSLKGLD